VNRAATAVLAATVDVPAMVLAAGGLVTVLTAVGAGWAVFRTAAIRASMTTIIQANAELRLANEDLHHEVALEKEKRAELAGQLSVFVDGLADRIVGAVTEAWRRTHPNETGGMFQ